jgi:ubiquinone/menaquinone biosynthesis C-methylase UbiE
VAALLTKWKDIWQRFSGRGAYPHELAWFLLLPLRRWILSPEQLVAQLRLDPSARVLEIGPGPGFFSVAVAGVVPQGRLELVDIQHEMLTRARERMRDAGIRNAGVTQANAVALPFLRDTFDVAFLVAVLGEVPDPQACVASVSRVLRPGGRLVFAELPGDPDRLTPDQLRALVAATPLEVVGSERVGRATITTFANRCT